MFKHLKDVNMTYIEHFRFATRIYMRLQQATWALLIHMIWPDVFESTASTILKNLVEELKQKNL